MTSGGTAAWTGGADGTRLALRFIAAAREDSALHDSLVEAASDGRLEVVVELAAEAGFPIGIDDLRAAFALDWGLRRARYLRD